MAVIKGKMKAGEKFTGKLVSIDTDDNKLVIIDANNKEIVTGVNSITAEYISEMFSKDDDITISFDGIDYDVE